jgi:hypothetical protein
MSVEWLIYRRPDDFVRTNGLPQLVVMGAKNYDKWAETSGIPERDRFPVVARGLTGEQARAMVGLTQEKENEI